MLHVAILESISRFEWSVDKSPALVYLSTGYKRLIALESPTGRLQLGNDEPTGSTPIIQLQGLALMFCLVDVNEAILWK